MPLKIMLQGDSPTNTSAYGKSNGLLLEIFRKLHHQVAMFAHYGVEGAMVKMGDINVYGRAMSQYGGDVIDAHMAKEGSDLLITNVDPFVLEHYGDRGFAWLPLVPVAGDPVSEQMKHSLKGAIDVVSISKFSQEILKEAAIPSTHIYLPIRTDFYHPIDRTKIRDAFPWPQDAYVVGHVGMNRGYRKGHDILIRAFQMFLGEVPNALLYMHTDVEQHDGINLKEIIEELGLRDKILYPSRYDAFTGVSELWMNGLFNVIDLYVQPSLTEGQCLPVWEALSTGQPIVATDAHSITEAIQNADAIAVPWKNKIRMPTKCWGYEVTADDLADAMYQAYRKWGKKYVSLRNRQIAIENVSVDEIAHKWYPELLKVEKMTRYTPISRPWKEKPKVTQVSTRVHNCGIGNYTRALMASMSDATEQECIDILEMKSGVIKIPQCDIVFLHYEDSIFPSESVLMQSIMEAKYRGAKVGIIYHTINPQVMARHFKQRIADLAVIHYPMPNVQFNDERVWVLGGMGCPMYPIPDISHRQQYRERYGFSQFDIIVSTFGFASIGRAHFELLEQIAPIMKIQPRIKLQLLISENFLNPGGFAQVHKRIQKIVQEYDLYSQVHVVSDFLPDVEILDRLWMSDLGFLYIDGHTPSSSSAAGSFISARLPLVVCPSSHFAHLRRGVIRTGDFSIIDFARIVWDTAQNQNILNRLRQEQNETYEQWKWPVFGQGYLSICKRLMNG